MPLEIQERLLVSRSVTRIKQRPTPAQTAGELGGTKGTTYDNSRQKTTKDKRHESTIHVNWHAVAFGAKWDVRSMRVGIMASEALRGSFRMHARARPLRIAQCPALPFYCLFFNSNQPGPSRATASFPEQRGL